MDCKIRGCRNLETICSDCKRVVCTYTLDSKWKSFKDNEPPEGIKLLIKKHFISHEWDSEAGGYDNARPIKTDSFIALDTYIGGGRWLCGGMVTEWMEIPE